MRSHRFPLPALRAFDASAETLNFRIAAKHLGVTPGAIAQHVRNLELSLGVALFERLPKGLMLTPAGLRFKGPIREAFQLIGEAEDAVAVRRQTVVISVPPTFGARWLIPRLDSFQRTFPNIELQVSAGNALADFTHDGVDLAVRQGRCDQQGTVALPFLELSSYPLAAPHLIETWAKTADGFHPRNWPLIHDLKLPLIHDVHAPWEKWFGAQSIEFIRPLEGLKVSQTSMAIEAAALGNGLALAPLEYARPELETRRLVVAHPVACPVPTKLHIVRKEAGRLSSKIEAVITWLLEEAALTKSGLAHYLPSKDSFTS